MAYVLPQAHAWPLSSSAHVIINEVLDTLEPHEARVLRLVYGLDHEYGPARMTLAETGAVVGRSAEAVRQTKEKALRRLRHTARSRYLRERL